ncbi:DEAD/DEAH box helicase [Candidatus Falkowbacteria bacterium]|jgi:ATP-dependent RNA helicase RhlE|nr:DEAD/DEAH box helicase [Candidatus Falkowbacteria bacterium]MBT7007064.1 DEAD/DEAH box helicase [Candidatus Falkowbacteria bacterium]
MTEEKQPTGRFSDLGIEKKLLTILSKKGFEIPTPIQHQIIPGALDGKDVVGIAQTGTGKTLAFGIPMIERLMKDKGQGLVVVPTRELALQVEKAIVQIGSAFGLRTVVVIGGVSQHNQVRSLRNNPHIVIATPGRLADLMQQGVYNLSKVNVITLDEADRMLDVGFLPEIKRILSAAPPKRQTMLFSATMPRAISELASSFMKLPIRIEIAPQGTSSELVEQEVFVVSKMDKMRLLDSVLNEYKDQKVLIFSRTKYGAKRIARDVRGMKHSATEIHSNRSQNQREIALNGFSTGKFKVMVATDIAARGIDVKDISLVINFDLPDCLEDYVHRIGRTGRAGKYGKAVSFVTQGEKYNVRRIEKLIHKTLPILDLPTLPAARPKVLEERPGYSGRSNRSSGRSDRSSSRDRRPSGGGGRGARFGDRTRSPRPQGRAGGGRPSRFSERPSSSRPSSSRPQRKSEGRDDDMKTFHPKSGVSRIRNTRGRFDPRSLNSFEGEKRHSRPKGKFDPRPDRGEESESRPFKPKGKFGSRSKAAKGKKTYSRPKGKFPGKPKSSRPKTGFGGKPRKFAGKKKFSK